MRRIEKHLRSAIGFAAVFFCPRVHSLKRRTISQVWFRKLLARHRPRSRNRGDGHIRTSR